MGELFGGEVEAEYAAPLGGARQDVVLWHAGVKRTAARCEQEKEEGSVERQAAE